MGSVPLIENGAEVPPIGGDTVPSLVKPGDEVPGVQAVSDESQLKPEMSVPPIRRDTVPTPDL